MADFLRGISAGVERGLANLVTSKRAERAAKRDQRRYEGELMLRLGQAKSDRDYRNKMHAYRLSRDEILDRQWAEKIGLETSIFESNEAHRAATLAETVRTNKAAEEDRDLARTQDKEQFEASLAEQVRSRTDRNELTRLGILEDSRQSREALTQRKQEAIDAAKDRNIGRQLQRESQQTQAEYYDNIIRLREQELNRPLTDLEKREIEAEIRLKESQTQYNNRRGGETGGITFPQSRAATSDFAKSFGDSFLKQFTEQGGQWTFPFFHKPQVGEGAVGGRLNWPPLRIDQVLPWEHPGDPSADTQQKRLRSLGGEAFRGLLQEMGDVNAAMNRVPTFFAELLSDPDRREQFVAYLMHTPLNNPRTGQPYTEAEMLRLALTELRDGAESAYTEMLNEALNPPPPPGSQNDPMLDFDDTRATPDAKQTFPRTPNNSIRNIVPPARPDR